MSTIQRLFLAGLVVLGLGLGLNWFSQTRTANDNQTPFEKVRLSVNTWVGFGPLWLAQEEGIFARHHLDVDLIVMEDTAQRTAAMTKGDIDAYGDTVDLLVATRDRGVPAVAVMQFDISDGADGILASDQIKTIADLRGKTIAVQQNFVSEAFLDLVLFKNGLNPSEVTKIDTEAGAAGAAFVAGQVDAAVTFEPWLSKAQERSGGHVLVTSKDVPGVLVDLLSVNETYLASHPASVSALMEAWFEAVDFAKANPSKANAMMAKHYNVTGEEFAGLLEGVIWPDKAANKAYFSAGGGEATVEAVVNLFSDLFLKTGKIGKPVDLSKAIDRQFIEGL